ncbi:MAG: hypothetical protein AAGB22_07700 [Bacteroidota bacterium]
MKTMRILALVALCCWSCSNDDDGDDTGMDIGDPLCAKTALLSNDAFVNAPADQVTLNSVAVDGNCLLVNFSASGCSGDSWEVNLIGSLTVRDSDPPQRSVRFSLGNSELCQAFITQEISFDLTPLRAEGNGVYLNIVNSGESVLYEY